MQRACACGAVMRLVVTTPNVRRVLAITGVDSLVDVYPSVAAALADESSQSRKPRPGYAGTQTDPDGWAAQPS